MKKIAFIIQHLTNGGAERTISNLSVLLKDEYDISIIVFDGKNVTYPYGGKIIDLNLPPRSGIILKVITTIKRIIKVKKIKKKENFETVISFMFGANIVNVLSKTNEKVITSVRNYMSAYGINKKSLIRERYIAKKSDKIITLSKMVEKDLNNNFKISSDKTITIYNPCDINYIKSLSKENSNFKFEKDIFYFVTAGRMVKQKGQWHLIKAFYKFQHEYPKSKLLILGDGELKNKLVKLVKDLNIESKVVFIGFIDNPYSFISKSNCFVLSSLFEALGNVIIEAMVCETPIISYDCLAGPRELIAPNTNLEAKTKEAKWEECGILVEACDQSENFDSVIEDSDINLYLGMKMAYENLDKLEKCSDNAKVRVIEFSPEKILEKWKNVI